jgi:hypothetical protein
MIARGQRRRVPPPFAPAGSPGSRIGPAVANAPIRRPRRRARGPPGQAGSISRWSYVAGAAHHSVPGHAAGPAVGPRQPSGNQAPALNQQTKETW